MNPKQYMNFSNIYSNHNINITSFYKNIKSANFNQITLKKILKLKLLSRDLNNVFNNKNIRCNKTNKYMKIMEIIKTDPTISSEAEKFFLFMFSIDPNFEAFKIYNEFNNIDEIKNAMINYFGIYDKCLIIIEKVFINYFLPKKQKEEINEEINKRLYK